MNSRLPFVLAAERKLGRSPILQYARLWLHS